MKELILENLGIVSSKKTDDDNKKTILVFLGTRPNYIKAAVLIEKLKNYFNLYIIDSGQHANHKLLSEDFIKTFNIKINKYCDYKIFKHQKILDSLIKDVQQFVYPKTISCGVVFGDCDTGLYASLTCHSLGIPIVHIESGLRSFLPKQREEYNRIIIDRLSSHCFVTEESGILNLEREGLTTSILVGNLMIDSLVKYYKDSKFYKQYGRYILLTLHRSENVDNSDRLFSIINGIKKVLLFPKYKLDDYKILFPIHPRTQTNFGKQLKQFKFLEIIHPVDYQSSINLIDHSFPYIITDSGGVQEEACWLKKKCITVRESTERPSTVIHGSNLICNDLLELDYYDYRQFLKSDIHSIPMWDGKTANRIVKYLRKIF